MKKLTDMILPPVVGALGFGLILMMSPTELPKAQAANSQPIYEYRELHSESFNSRVDMNELRQLGAQGFEIAGMAPASNGYHVIYLKRRVR